MSFFTSQPFGQQQQPAGNTGFSFSSQTTTPAFGAAPNAASSGTSLFGSNNPAPQAGAFGAFGANNNAPGGAFGASSFGLSNFGANNAQPSTGAFGSSLSANPSTGNTLGFGSAAPSSGFNMNPSGTSGFGSSSMTGGSNFGSLAAGNAMATAQNRGTGDPTYSVTVNSSTPDATGTFHSICGMPAYKNYSIEELRLQDYKMGKLTRGAGIGSGASASFGGTQTAGGFGSQPASLGFGAQSNAFGTANTQQSGFGKPAGFGGMNSSLPGSAFGASAATPAFGSGTSAFGSNVGASGFNTQPAPGAAPTFGAFGGAGGGGAFGQSTTSAFGAQPNNQGAATGMSLGFGNTAAQPAQSTGFGMFGATASKPAFGGMNTGGMMGNNASTTSTAPGAGSFGFNTGNQAGTNTGFGGGMASTVQPTFGGSTMFGGTSQPQTNTGFGTTGMFGSAQQGAPAANTGFGASASQPFGASTLNASKPMTGFNTTAGATSTGGGLFGAGGTNAFQMGAGGPAKPPAPFGNAFGTSAPASTPGTGLALNTGGMFGGGQSAFGSKPLGGMPTASAPVGAFGTSGMGGFGASAPAGFGLQQQPSFQQQQQQNQAAMFTQSQMAPALTASVDQNPYGKSQLFDLVPESVIKTVQDHPVGANLLRLKPVDIEEESTREAALSTSRLVKISPSQITRARLGISGFHETSSLSQPYALTRGGLGNGGSITESSNFSRSVYNTPKASSSGIIPPVSFTPRSSVKRLDVRSPEIHIPFASSTPSQSAARGSSPDVGLKTPSKPPRRGLAQPQLMPVEPYVISPSLIELESMSLEQRTAVRNLTVTHPEFGSVTFLAPVDLTNVNLKQICGTHVRFVNGEFILYGDDESCDQKRSLDMPAKVTLLGKWPLTTTRQPSKIMNADDPIIKAYVERLKKCSELSFQDYDPSTGAWTFIINPAN